MTAHSGTARAVVSPTVRARRPIVRGVRAATRRLLGLGGVSLALGAAIVAVPDLVPLTILMVPLLLASLYLSPRHVPAFVGFLMVLMVGGIVRQPDMSTRLFVAVAVMVLMGLIVVLAAARRSRLGVAGHLGESMFVDLRDRILSQGGIPDLPPSWHVESALRSAGGTPFAGDFVVASRPERGRLEVVVVDVSGKGEDAGTRALLLSGAFGGLLSALAPAEFLRAANEYLLRQEWEEGFATAVHLSLDLVTGRYEVRTAGHPPAALRAAGSGRWSVLPSQGPLLGLFDDAEYVCASGVLLPGDAMLLYTDGMVERPRRDIDLGIDRMLGQAETLLRGDFTGASTRLVEALGSRDDDRAIVVVSRS